MLTLRPTTADDLPDVTSWEREPDTATWLGETGHAWHSRALADPDQEHVLALSPAGPVSSAVPVGFAVLAGLHGGTTIELRRMVVAPAHRGSGRGRAMLRAVLERAYRHHGARTVWLDVKPHNHRARVLYETFGFVVRETRRNAMVEPDGTPCDLVIMVHQSQ